MRRIILLMLAAILAGCAEQRATEPTPAPAAAIEAAAPTSAPPAPTQPPPVPPSTTAEPTAVPATPTTTQRVPATPAPPTATPDPWAEYAQFTIEGLRAREYGTEGEIEIVEVMEETASFTRYLIAYPSDGLRITGMMNLPYGDGPFPVVILNHGYYPLDVYQTGNGTKLAADYLADRGFLTLSPD
ncbi:MAG TPA: hypothetical protein VD886_22610, partial [Herpetosiphonaceae bacterium]|nr:hypothetical protein [Herpetosiphonaceae bacterium]